MTNSNFQIGQLVKIEEIDNNKNRASILILRESTSTLDGSKFRCRYTIKLEALNKIN
jgi:hypothetical protein